MDQSWIRLLGIFLFGLSTTARADPPAGDATAVVDCVAGNAPQRSYTGQILLRTEDAQGQAQLLEARFIGTRKDGSLALNLRLTAPADMSGTTLLLKEQNGEDSVHVYLPGLRRSRRVVGSMAEKEVWGTGLSYLDFKQLFGALREGELVPVPGAAPSDPPQHHLRFVQQADTPDSGQDIQIWVEQQRCVPLRIESRDAEQKLSKSLWAEPDSITAVDDKWVATRWTVQNESLRLRTEARIEELRYDDGVPPRAFQTSTYFEVP